MGKNQIGVIGLGKFGLKFAMTLARLNQTVIGVDSRAENVKRAQETLSQCYQADATNKKVLEQLGFGDLSHVLVSTGDSIAASSMITMFLKELGVPAVWVKAVNSDHEKLLLKVGADEVIMPEYMAAKQLATRIAIPGFVEHLPFDPTIALQEVVVTRWHNKTLRDIDITNRFNVQVIAIRKEGEKEYALIPQAGTILKRNDTLMIIGHAKDFAQLEP